LKSSAYKLASFLQILIEKAKPFFKKPRIISAFLFNIDVETMIRNDWTRDEIQALYDQPLMDLLFQAQQIHREHLMPIPYRSAPYSLLKPVVVRKTVNTVPSLPITIQIWKLKKE